MRTHIDDRRRADDYSVTMPPHEQVVLWEWVPGGSDLIVDNFNDMGCIDGEPPRLLRRIFTP